MSLDVKDLRILSLLDDDCRLSANQIGKAVKLSPEAVNYRIRNLEKQNVLERYFVQIDFFRLGYKLMRLYVKLQNASAEVLQAIITKTLSEKNLWALYEIDGHCDLAIGLLVRNLNDYLEFQNRFISDFGEYIAAKEISVFTGIAYFPKKYLNSGSRDYSLYYIEETPQIEQIDDVDKKILALLTENAKTPLLSIAKQVGLTANAVKYRIKQLEKRKIILRYRAQINAKMMGRTYYKIDMILNDGSIIPSLREHIKQHPNIIFEDICVGGSDFEFDGEFRSDEEMQEMVDELYRLFPKKIRTHYYYKAKRIHVYKYYLLK